MDRYADFQTDHLLITVGTNPLPCYIAARLLAMEKTRLHLLVSEGIKRQNIHQRLMHMLGKDPEDESQYLTIDPSNPQNIKNAVERRVRSCKGSWGLKTEPIRLDFPPHMVERCQDREKRDEFIQWAHCALRKHRLSCVPPSQK